MAKLINPPFDLKSRSKCPLCGIFLSLPSQCNNIYYNVYMEEFVIEINGMIDHYGWQRSNVRYLLNKNKGKRVRCKINSWGGSVNEAIAISKLFEEHGNVVVEFIGFCASAVTWMAFGAASREMHEDSLWLCHKSSIPVDVYGQMNADQLAEAIQKLQNDKKNQEAIDLIIAKKYAEKCAASGKTMKDVCELMKQERWLPAEDVLTWGFIDKVIPGINKVTNEYRNLMIENCAALQLPIPAFPEELPKEDLADRIINGVKSLFKLNQNSNNPNPQTTMKKDYVAVNTLLGVEGLAEKDGKVELTTEQMQKIADALTAAATDKQTIEETVKALDAMSDNIKEISGLTNKVNAVKAVMTMLPAGVPAGNVIPKEKPEVDYADSKKDPVNQYFDNED